MNDEFFITHGIPSIVVVVIMGLVGTIIGSLIATPLLQGALLVGSFGILFSMGTLTVFGVINLWLRSLE